MSPLESDTVVCKETIRQDHRRSPSSASYGQYCPGPDNVSNASEEERVPTLFDDPELKSNQVNGPHLHQSLAQ